MGLASAYLYKGYATLAYACISSPLEFTLLKCSNMANEARNANDHPENKPRSIKKMYQCDI